jgi:hypothetical protein
MPRESLRQDCFDILQDSAMRSRGGGDGESSAVRGLRALRRLANPKGEMGRQGEILIIDSPTDARNGGVSITPDS